VQAGGALVRTESARGRLVGRENVFTPPPFLRAPLVVAVLIPAPHGRGKIVVPEPPIRRRGDNAMDRFIRERAQHLPAIADQQTEGAHAAHSFRWPVSITSAGVCCVVPLVISHRPVSVVTGTRSWSTARSGATSISTRGS